MIPIPDKIVPGSKVLFVGDYASADDVWKQAPLSGSQGDLLARMMADVGLLQTEASFTLAYRYRPEKEEDEALLWEKKAKSLAKGFVPVPGKLYAHPQLIEEQNRLAGLIADLKPELVVPLGNIALWALTGENSVNNWRGSYIPKGPLTVIPTYHPRMINKVWEWRTFAARDLQRVKDYLDNPQAYQQPEYRFVLRPTYGRVYSILQMLLVRLNSGIPVHISCDIETLARHISVIGIAWSRLDALVIPFINEVGTHYWQEAEEFAIHMLLKQVLTHPLAKISGQNFAYDAQHFAKHLGYIPRLVFDTMVQQHTLYPGIPKDLAFLSSMYCHHHLYWKDELEDYNSVPKDIDSYWAYNGKDCCKTWEIAEVLAPVIESQGLQEQYDFLLVMWRRVLNCMLRGVRIDKRARGEVTGELMEYLAVMDTVLHTICDFPINPGSPLQVSEFLYQDLKLPVQRHKKTKQPTTDEEALAKLAKGNPLAAPFLNLLAQRRSLGVFLSTFCLMPLDSDGRMRTMYNVAGTETYRMNSAKNAFGSGGNLQNIPKGDEA